MISLSVSRSGRLRLRHHRLIASLLIALEGFIPIPKLALSSLAIVPRITRRTEAHDTRVEGESIDSCMAAVRFPEPDLVSKGDTRDAFSRKEQLGEVFPAPPVAEIAMFFEAVEVDQAELWGFPWGG